MQVTVWSDYLCPWCYLNKQRVARLVDVHGIEVVWRPYELHPDILDSGHDLVGVYGKGDPARAEASLQRFVDMAADEGVAFRPPARVLPTRKAHLLAIHVQRTRPELFGAVHDALFDAIWVDDRDVTDVGVLGSIAEGCGVEAGFAVEAVDAEGGLDELRLSREEAADNGVVGVPATMFPSGFVLPGFQTVDTVDRIAARIIERS